MDSSGPRRILQPLLYLVLAAMAHALLLLVPIGRDDGKGSGRMRGIRIKTLSGGGSGTKAGLGGEGTGQADPRAQARTAVPASTGVGNRVFSAGGTTGMDRVTEGSLSGGGTGSTGDGIGTGRGDPGGSVPQEGNQYQSYLDRLRSKPVQGWARESAGKNRQVWSGSGKPTEVLEIGPGETKPAPRTGSGYLDPRVRMVVTSYPPTGIEKRYTQVPYPELQIKKHEFTSGWWNVYIQIQTDREGKVVRRSVVRPETDGPRERLFVEPVQKEIDRWRFDPAEAEILVDVRFHVE